MVYQGRIDDRYVDFGKSQAAPNVRDVADAIEATLNGNPVLQKTTQAVGCYIGDLK